MVTDHWQTPVLGIVPGLPLMLRLNAYYAIFQTVKSILKFSVYGVSWYVLSDVADSVSLLQRVMRDLLSALSTVSSHNGM